jgi:hypothetical protein
MMPAAAADYTISRLLLSLRITPLFRYCRRRYYAIDATLSTLPLRHISPPRLFSAISLYLFSSLPSDYALYAATFTSFRSMLSSPDAAKRHHAIFDFSTLITPAPLR